MINALNLKSVGIVGFGGYIPKYRLTVAEIAAAHGQEAKDISRSLGVQEKSVANFDEDTITMAVEAAKVALLQAAIDPQKIGAVFVGSESHPYAVKPSSTVIAEVLGLGHEYLTADLQFACQAAITGIQIVAGLLESGLIDYGLVIGADKAQSRKGDILEYTAASAAAAFIFGRKKSEFLARLEGFTSYSSDTPDFWRRSGQPYPSHGGRFTGDVAYFHHILQSTEKFLQKFQRKISDYHHVILHMPNAKFPKLAAQILKVTAKQLRAGFIVEQIGNPYAASCPLALCRVLEKASKNQHLLLTSYGSGAGSTTLSFKTTSLLAQKRKLPQIDDFLNTKEEITYLEYLKKSGEF